MSPFWESELNMAAHPKGALTCSVITPSNSLQTFPVYSLQTYMWQSKYLSKYLSNFFLIFDTQVIKASREHCSPSLFKLYFHNWRENLIVHTCTITFSNSITHEDLTVNCWQWILVSPKTVFAQSICASIQIVDGLDNGVLYRCTNKAWREF
jgi:hypothetical protein